MRCLAYLEDSDYKEALGQAADYLQIKIVQSRPKETSFISYNSKGLYFVDDSNKTSKSLYIDFLSGSLGWRLKRVEHEKLLKKTLGKTKSIFNIFDATAGFLSDSLIFLSLGHKVIACEQSKLLYILVKDACLRAKSELPFLENLTFLQGDSLDIYKDIKDIDVIYLDPMYPVLKKNSLRAGNLNLIRNILDIEDISDSQDSVALEFLKSEYKKIILKRPIKAQKICSNINYQIKGKSTRFDVYI